MKYFLIAGEASGDLHASNLMAALKEKDPEADFRFFGGDLMQAVGGTLSIFTAVLQEMWQRILQMQNFARHLSALLMILRLEKMLSVS